jgi:hypothetical protein
MTFVGQVAADILFSRAEFQVEICERHATKTAQRGPPMRRSGSSARYAKICSAKGYMQLAVSPEPTAPTMAMPVKSPRSGMTSQRGVSEGICLRGWCTSPTTRKSLVLFRGGRIKRQFACPNLAACLEGENVDAGKQDRIRDVGRCIRGTGCRST